MDARAILDGFADDRGKADQLRLERERCLLALKVIEVNLTTGLPATVRLQRRVERYVARVHEINAELMRLGQ